MHPSALAYAISAFEKMNSECHVVPSCAGRKRGCNSSERVAEEQLKAAPCVGTYGVDSVTLGRWKRVALIVRVVSMIASSACILTVKGEGVYGDRKT